MGKFFTSHPLLLVLAITVFAAPVPIWAAMSSSNYSIQYDSINFGGDNSSSTNYQEQDTMGEVASGDSSSANYNLHAGYQQMAGSFISISPASGSVSLPDIGGISGGSSEATSSFVVVTDDEAGYQMTVQASTNPALKGPGGAFFADYVPAGSSPDYSFTVASGQSVFGFSPEGTDITSVFRDNGSSCDTGSSDTPDHCWDGFSTSPITVAQTSAPNQPNGATTTLRYKAAVGASKIQDAGSYSATITVTALAQ